MHKRRGYFCRRFMDYCVGFPDIWINPHKRVFIPEKSQKKSIYSKFMFAEHYNSMWDNSITLCRLTILGHCTAIISPESSAYMDI